MIEAIKMYVSAEVTPYDSMQLCEGTVPKLLLPDCSQTLLCCF